MRWIGGMALGLSVVGGNSSSPGTATDLSSAAPSAQSKWFNPANRFKNPQALASARRFAQQNLRQQFVEHRHTHMDTLMKYAA